MKLDQPVNQSGILGLADPGESAEVAQRLRLVRKGHDQRVEVSQKVSWQNRLAATCHHAYSSWAALGI